MSLKLLSPSVGSAPVYQEAAQHWAKKPLEKNKQNNPKSVHKDKHSLCSQQLGQKALLVCRKFVSPNKTLPQ